MPFIKHIILLVSIWIMIPAQTQVQVTREYQLKAAFLFNFCQFVDWPDESFSKNEEPLIIGILGNNPFKTYLEETVKGERIGMHPVEVRYYKTADEVGECHLLFLAIGDLHESSAVIAALKEKSVLTISDHKGFMEQHGMIRFLNQGNKIRFEINVEATKAAGLEVSSKLLRLADIYTPSKTQ